MIKIATMIALLEQVGNETELIERAKGSHAMTDGFIQNIKKGVVLYGKKTNT